jgi:DNA polymerase III epsilon subunit-like protein
MHPALAFLDIETTGLNPFEHEVLEVAYVREIDGSYSETHFSLPIRPWAASEDALRINKYEERHEELRKIEITPAFAVHLLQMELQDCMLVGANPTFDATFLRALIWQYRHEEPTWYYRVLDLNAWASGWLQHAGVLKTPYIAEQFNVPLTEDRHTALADARWNRDIFHAVANHG